MTRTEFIKLQHKAVIESIDTPIYYNWADQWFETTIRGMYLFDDDQYCPDTLKVDVNEISFYDDIAYIGVGYIANADNSKMSTVKFPKGDGWVVDSDDSAIPLSMLTSSMDNFILDKVAGDATEMHHVIGPQRW